MSYMLPKAIAKCCPACGPIQVQLMSNMMSNMMSTWCPNAVQADVHDNVQALFQMRSNCCAAWQSKGCQKVVQIMYVQMMSNMMSQMMSTWCPTWCPNNDQTDSQINSNDSQHDVWYSVQVMSKWWPTWCTWCQTIVPSIFNIRSMIMYKCSASDVQHDVHDVQRDVNIISESCPKHVQVVS